jgi:hypothetical protein
MHLETNSPRASHGLAASAPEVYLNGAMCRRSEPLLPSVQVGEGVLVNGTRRVFEPAGACPSVVGGHPTLERFGAELTVDAVGPDPTVKSIALDPTVGSVALDATVESVALDPTVESIAVDPTVGSVALDATVESVALDPTVKFIALDPAVESASPYETLNLRSLRNLRIQTNLRNCPPSIGVITQ